ncbi:hypothetical protein COLO4_35083 [Corchorus olitorius]|uniref:Uncharacterized protein n=1 Tax=Corchorus olitorius TaxID=93759 RepID=A0A1R3GII5_9ROSI|nr:hypothetical protein COLO4_35083 [Corchorus olitorius]
MTIIKRQSWHLEKTLTKQWNGGEPEEQRSSGGGDEKE